MARIILSKNCCDCEGLTDPCAPCETGCCVYPASCNAGPDEILFYEEVLSKKPDGFVYGDLTNGVELKDGVWNIYRNGNKTEKQCLPFNSESLNFPKTSVEAILSSVYSGSITANFGFPIGSDLGEPDIRTYGFFLQWNCLIEAEPNVIWGGAPIPFTQDFDEGFSLFFNPDSCRWEFQSGPINALYAYKSGSQTSPIGSYVTVPSYILEVTIS